MNLNWDQNPHRLSRLAASVVVLALMGGVAAANQRPSQQTVALGHPVPGSGDPSGSAGSPSPSVSPSSLPATPTPVPTPGVTNTTQPLPTLSRTAPGRTPKSAATPTPAATATPTPGPAYTYRNGTYSTTGTYLAPGYTETIGVSLTVTNDVVTGTSATNLADNPESRFYQNEFISRYSSSVVGKPLATLTLGKIGASSLTPSGFNNAAAKIRNLAK